jgi:protein-disulfide isomerase
MGRPISLAVVVGFFCWVSATCLADTSVAAPAEMQATGGTEDTTADERAAERARLMAIVRERQKPSRAAKGTVDIAGRPAIGSRDAPLAIVEFSSLQCAFCRRHASETMPGLKERFVDTGDVLYVFVDIALDPAQAHAQRAAEAAHCAGEQDRYWAFRQRLLGHQKALAPVFLDAHAGAVGLDLERLGTCLDDGRYLARTRQDLALARELRVHGTPTFFLGRVHPGAGAVSIVRRISGAQPLELFAQDIDALGGTSPELSSN